VEDFTAATVTVTYDPKVLDLDFDNISDGDIGGNTLDVSYAWVPSDEVDTGEIIVTIWGDIPGFTGEGYLMDLPFHVIGEPCQTSPIGIDGTMSDSEENEIPAVWVDGSVHVCEPRTVVSGTETGPAGAGTARNGGWVPPGPPPGYVECDEFMPCEWVWVWGYGFETCQTYRIWIQPYEECTSVTEGQPLDEGLCPEGFPDGGEWVEVHIDEDGKFGPVPIWHVQGELYIPWEIVADKMNVEPGDDYDEDIYNADEDGLDAVACGEWGFHIYPEGLTIVLVSLGLAAVGGYLVVRRHKGTEIAS